MQITNQDEPGAHAKDELVFDVGFFGLEVFQYCFFKLVVVFYVGDVWW